jgi:hypothetical protein
MLRLAGREARKNVNEPDSPLHFFPQDRNMPCSIPWFQRYHNIWTSSSHWRALCEMCFGSGKVVSKHLLVPLHLRPCNIEKPGLNMSRLVRTRFAYKPFLLWGQEVFSSPQCPDRLWGPPSLLSDGYRGLCPLGWGGRGLKLTTHLHLVPRSGMVELYFHSPLHLHGLLLNWLSTGTALPFTPSSVSIFPRRRMGSSLLFWKSWV